MKSGKDGVRSPSFSPSSPVPPALCPLSRPTPTFSTPLLNTLNLTSGTPSANHELTKFHYYNDLKTRNTNMSIVKDVNLKRDHLSSGGLLPEFQNEVWRSFGGQTNSRLVHQATIRESTFFKDPSIDKPQNHNHEKNINLIVEQEKGLNSSKSLKNKCHNDVTEKWPNVEFQENGKMKEAPEEGKAYKHSEKARKWWRGRISSSRESSNQQSASASNSITGSIRRSRFWNSISRTLELPERLRKEDKSSQKVSLIVNVLLFYSITFFSN